MILLAHRGITVGAAYAWERGRPRAFRWDNRLVLLGSVLPDLIDKSLARSSGVPIIRRPPLEWTQAGVRAFAGPSAGRDRHRGLPFGDVRIGRPIVMCCE